MARIPIMCSRRPVLQASCEFYHKLFCQHVFYNQLNRGVSTLTHLFTKTPFENYDKSRELFDLRVPEYYNFATDVIDKWANFEQSGQRSRDVPALWWMDENNEQVKWTFKELSEYSQRAANILTSDCGLDPLDKMIVILPRVLPWWVLNLAAIRAGVILSPGTVLLTSKDIHHRLVASKAKCIVTGVDQVDAVDQVANDVPSLKTKMFVGPRDAEKPGWINFNKQFQKANLNFQSPPTKSCDPMMLFFTSGTTGHPKMAEHTHASYGLGHLLTARFGLGLNPEDIFWNLSDTGWAKAAWSSLFAPWIAGSCVFQQNTAKFNSYVTLKALREHPVTVFCAPPTAFRMLITEDLKAGKLESLRCSISGGEPVNPEIIEAWESGTGVQLFELYGQTETTFVCGNYPCIKHKPGSMGKASPGIDLEIVDNDGNIVDRGVEGIIGVRVRPNRPVGLFTQYINDPERNASVFKGDFYLTGDKAYMDDEGYIFFVGRSDDVIISAGYRIGPFEVESVLLEHPAVAESAVVSSPDDLRNEVVKAFIILTDSYKDKSDKESLKKEIQEFVKRTTSPHKYPRKIEFVSELPKTVSGKIRRVELRNREWS